ncbi:DUF4367 domain-containing protein [Halovivax cerinus]|uniref:DUF4367 domain-containing protein n=1 Tax=Halovivax cerinus TaxID=1487865 RepID=A0ABD5NJ72_9EURY|nr:DUF4367 domain-containing protein [Halovivax cerinus]
MSSIDAPLTRRVLPVAAVVALLLLAGCSAVTLDGDPDPERIGELAEERYDDIDSYSATITYHADGERLSVQEVVAAPHENKQYIETVESGGESSELVTVSNGSVTWTYQPDENTVRLFDQSTPLENVSYSEQIEEMVENSEISYDGTDTVDDRDTHVVTVVPDDTNGTETTYWLDQETYFPVKYELTHRFDGETSVMTVEYTDLEFDVDPDPALFEFDPPADAVVERIATPSFERFDTIATAEDETGIEAPTPDVPDGYEFTEVAGTFTDGDGDELLLTYERDDDTITVATGTEMDGLSEDAKSITIDGHDGEYIESERIAILAWSCDDVAYRVSGTTDVDTLSAIAASIDC